MKAAGCHLRDGVGERARPGSGGTNLCVQGTLQRENVTASAKRGEGRTGTTNAVGERGVTSLLIIRQETAEETDCK